MRPLAVACLASLAFMACLSMARVKVDDGQLLRKVLPPAKTPDMQVATIQLKLVCDLEDALDIAGSSSQWEGIVRRARELGWALSADGWIAGRLLLARLVATTAGAYDVEQVYMPQGAFACSIRRPHISICGGPRMLPFPEEDEFVDEFDLFWRQSNCREADRPYVIAAYRVMAHWFDMD